MIFFLRLESGDKSKGLIVKERGTTPTDYQATLENQGMCSLTALV
jgi:hypothetical protein